MPEVGDGGDAVQDGRAADGFFVEPRVGALGRIDDDLDFFALDEVDDVGAAFLDFEDAVDGARDLRRRRIYRGRRR